MQINMNKWPAPVIRPYLGPAVLAAADDSDANTKKGQVCEAHFYNGELTLQHGAKKRPRVYSGSRQRTVQGTSSSGQLLAQNSRHLVKVVDCARPQKPLNFTFRKYPAQAPDNGRGGLGGSLRKSRNCVCASWACSTPF